MDPFAKGGGGGRMGMGRKGGSDLDRNLPPDVKNHQAQRLNNLEGGVWRYVGCSQFAVNSSTAVCESFRWAVEDRPVVVFFDFHDVGVLQQQLPAADWLVCKNRSAVVLNLDFGDMCACTLGGRMREGRDKERSNCNAHTCGVPSPCCVYFTVYERQRSRCRHSVREGQVIFCCPPQELLLYPTTEC